jgi:hypothetical protein
MDKTREFTLSTLNRIVNGLLSIADDLADIPVGAESRRKVCDIVDHIRKAATQLTPWTTINGLPRKER